VTSIQGILIACCLLAAVLGSVTFRAKLAYRMLALFLGVTATIFVLFPEFTTVIAHALGVGRGTDLLLYLSLIAGVHAMLLLYLRIRELERKLTEHVRATALRGAKRTTVL